MNKKRYFLDPPEVKDYLVKGERFTKWSEVSEHFGKEGNWLSSENQFIT